MVGESSPKVGIISCGGEELAEGTVSRVATRLVLETLRPDQTVALCLPLLLAGDDGERSFAKLHPAIAVDGCVKHCAAKATAAYSGEPAAAALVSQIAQRFPELKPTSRRRLGDGGMALARLVAEEIAARVDDILDRPAATALAMAKASGVGACACSGAPPSVPVSIGGTAVGIVGLREIFRQLLALGWHDDARLREELLRTVKIYNYVPSGQEAAYAEALWREFVAHRAAAGATG